MLRLEKLGVPPKLFLDLKDDVPLCASWIFGTEIRQTWWTKGNKSGSVHKDTDNKTEYSVSVDHIKSDHPGLVTQL